MQLERHPPLGLVPSPQHAQAPASLLELMPPGSDAHALLEAPCWLWPPLCRMPLQSLPRAGTGQFAGCGWWGLSLECPQLHYWHPSGIRAQTEMKPVCQPIGAL